EIKGVEAPAFIEDWAYGKINARPDGSNDVGKQAIGVLPPLGKVGEAALAGGFVNLEKDKDAAPRSENFAWQFDGETYPPLSLAAASAYLGVSPLDLEIELGSSFQLGSVQVGDRQLLTNSAAKTLVNY